MRNQLKEDPGWGGSILPPVLLRHSQTPPPLPLIPPQTTAGLNLPKVGLSWCFSSPHVSRRLERRCRSAAVPRGGCLVAKPAGSGREGSVLGAGRAGGRGSSHDAGLGLVWGAGAGSRLSGMLQATGLGSCQGTDGNR